MDKFLPDLGIAIKNGTAPAILRDGMRVMIPLMQNEMIPTLDNPDGTCEISIETMGYMGTFVFQAKSATVVRHAIKAKRFDFILTHDVQDTRHAFNAVTNQRDDFAPIAVKFA